MNSRVPNIPACVVEWPSRSVEMLCFLKEMGPALEQVIDEELQANLLAGQDRFHLLFLFSLLITILPTPFPSLVTFTVISAKMVRDGLRTFKRHGSLEAGTGSPRTSFGPFCF